MLVASLCFFPEREREGDRDRDRETERQRETETETETESTPADSGEIELPPFPSWRKGCTIRDKTGKLASRVLAPFLQQFVWQPTGGAVDVAARC